MIDRIIKKMKCIISNDIKFFRLKKQIINKLGLLAENVVILFLRLKGYNLIKHRYSNYYGEIDIIFKKGKTIVFVEVKARSGYIDYYDIVSKKQRQRIVRSSNFFMSKYDKHNIYSKRFDICIIKLPFLYKIMHIKNALQEDR